ncbi:uncharacterized protein K452DRAFT_305872 [Aplosporella prunicola CBS 121167]|uniref:RING-type domain-containing protein n=1 Tax=Aplosporella prunicola CBS 121167 TaxID=1176127 RepID=A0A6A6BNV2_9PEZI|nr:uncharacterized protein K452DRAFT_305872 [Aplosporella prunicola CBS 121167]KAF2144914.1 hypothetical protein K452DRAFT_305872 [Aplosporella prunicola CBS 121167]
MAMNQSMSALLLFAALTLFLLSLYNRVALYLARRKYKFSNGCLPCPSYPHKDPVLGLDMLLCNLRAARSHRVLDTLTHRLRTYGSTYRSLRLGAPAITTMDPANVKAILSTNFADYAIAPFRAPALGPFLGAGIFTTDGPHWATSRAMMRPAFARERLADLAALEQHVQDLLAHVRPRAAGAGPVEVDVQDLFFRLTMDSATGFLFGRSVRSLRTASSGDADSREARFAAAFAVAQSEAMKLLRLGPLRRLVWRREQVHGVPAVRVVHDYVDQFVDDALRYREALERGEAKEEEQQGAADRKYNFLHELARHTRDKRRIRDELLNVLLAGRDTTASLLGNLFFVLARRRDVWAKLKAEVAPLDGKPPSYEQLKNLTYVRHCLNESLRLHPVVPANTRYCVRDTTLPRGGGPTGTAPVFVARGTLVSWSAWAMHRRAKEFGHDADAFRPERWAAPSMRPGWAYVPFNGGPRVCVGQGYALTEAAYAVVRLVQSCEGVRAVGDEAWEEEVGLTCWCRGGVRVRVWPAAIRPPHARLRSIRSLLKDDGRRLHHAPRLLRLHFSPTTTTCSPPSPSPKTSRSLSAAMPSLMLLALIVALASAVTITPTNSSMPTDDGIQLKVVDQGAMHNISAVVPLTNAASQLDSEGVTGQLFLATDDTASNVTDKKIAYINCDASAYPGFTQASDVLATVVNGGAAAVLLFSPTSSYCNVSDADAGDNGAVYIYTMVDATISKQVLTDLDKTVNTPNAMRYLVTILPRDGSHSNPDGADDSNEDANTSPSNPLGPSPSTAVAMIILYTITGIITALFLVVIVTGALRAHRHPERYGPGVMVGRGGRDGQRQTRARGIARAMLDTIPIVKFGERAEPEPKPADVEMGETGTAAVQGSGDGERRGSADVTDDMQAAAEHKSGEAGQEAPTAPASTTTAADGDAVTPGAGAGAGVAAASTAPTTDEADSQGCTICTDDFERGQDIRVLPCDHKFHPACIDPWLLNVSGTCPLCRIDLHPAPTNTSATSAQTPSSAVILAPPLDADGAAAAGVPRTHNHHHRRSVREFLHLRHHGDAGERMAVARRMAGEGRGGSAGGAGTEGALRTTEEEGDGAGARRRSRRLSGLLLGGGRKRGGSVAEAEGAAVAAVPVQGVREEVGASAEAAQAPVQEVPLAREPEQQHVRHQEAERAPEEQQQQQRQAQEQDEQPPAAGEATATSAAAVTQHEQPSSGQA